MPHRLIVVFCVLLFPIGSTEDMFFESHAWLESDCEDYFSVNGGKITLRMSQPTSIFSLIFLCLCLEYIYIYIY